ncbi:MAG TPA: serine hydrolase domain-containing protein [Micromonosporaceae bacterium]|jgi:CubicO group peptidase (beta-lactamase class C family)
MLAAATALIDDVVAEGRVPGAVLATREGVHAVGRLATDGPPVAADTIYDLASLTKVVATLPCVLHLVANAGVGLDDPLSRYVPTFDHGRDRVTLRHLLTHTSGLPDGYPYFAMEGTPADRWAAVAAAAPVTEPDRLMVYSDIGFMLLGLVVERVTGAGLDEVAARVVFEPLGMKSTRYQPPAAWWPRCAATEADATGRPKVGVVHDENAESLGGVAGHAGLFGTAPDIAVYVQAWADPAVDVIRPDLRLEALRCQTAHVGACRGLGWTLRGDRWDHMGEVWPGSGAGHTGFTGTSIGFDPVSGAWAVLLTNGVHLGRDNSAVKELRRAVHDALAPAPAR